MILLNIDLDNTLIYSYKYNIGKDKRNVEIYKDREIGFMTEKTYELLKYLEDKICIVPTTTRTTEQYKRIELGIKKSKHALTCNGGVLLVEGKEDIDWYRISLELANEAQIELKKAIELLEKDKRVNFEIRFIKNLFVFTKAENIEDLIKLLKINLDTSLVDIFHSGKKLYIMPKKLSKGNAIKRFRAFLNPKLTIAAGDSVFDISMFKEADIGIAPISLSGKFKLPTNTVCMPEKAVYSEELLGYVRKLYKQSV